MKKYLSIVLMLCMLVSVAAPTLVFAADKTVTLVVGDVPVRVTIGELDTLADGEHASDATQYSDSRLIGIENQGFTHTDGVDAAVEATFELILDLGEVQTIGSISLDAYKESNSMIALPTVDYYVSLDGINYYQINAGNIVKPADDAAENTVVTLKADFSTRIAVKAQYVKAVVSFKNGWVFLSELSVGAGNATVVGEAPDTAYPYSEHGVSTAGIGVFDAADGLLDFSANDSSIGRLFRNSQLIKAAYDAELGAYVIEYSKVNPWPDGHSGVEELAEGEILVAISTGGVVTGDVFSGCKWIARGLTAGDLIVLNEGMIRFYPAGAEIPALPEAPEEPEVSDEPSAEPEEPETPVVSDADSLIPGKGTEWIKNDVDGAGVEVVYNDGEVVFFGSVPGTWPSVYVEYQEPIVADVDNDLLSIDFTVEGGATNLNFFLSDGNGGSYSYSISNTALLAACPDANVDCVGDLHDGVYTCTISIADLVSSSAVYMSTAFPAEAIVDGKITFVGINVYSVNGAVVTVRDLRIVRNDAEEPEEPEIPEEPILPEPGTNLALGKDVANAKINGANANYCANLTDGVTADAISTDMGVWFGYWYNAESAPDVLAEKSNTAENGIAIPTIDLGSAVELSSVRMHIVDQADWGISAPTSAIAQVSNDGETFIDVATVTEFESGVSWVEFDLSGQTARYVRIAIDLSSLWFFLDEIEICGFENEPEVPETVYGDVDGDGVINGKDATKLLQYLANYDYETGVSTEEVFAGADCNGDGIINGRDSVRLLMYLANYDPSTGSSSIVLGPEA